MAKQTTQAAPAAEEITIPQDEMHTLVDRMLGFIQEHGKTTVAEIADVFAMDQAQVERLASVLEESGLISMRYALLHPGRTELISLRKPEKGAEAGQPAQSSSLPKRAQSAASGEHHDFELRDMMKGVDADMQESQAALNTIERDVLSRLFRIEKTLTEIERKERSASKVDIDYLMVEADALEKMRKDMTAKIKTFDARIISVGSRIRHVKHAVRKGVLHGIIGFFTAPFRRRPKEELMPPPKAPEPETVMEAPGASAPAPAAKKKVK